MCACIVVWLVSYGCLQPCGPSTAGVAAGKTRKRGHDADADGFADDGAGMSKRPKTESAR